MDADIISMSPLICSILLEPVLQTDCVHAQIYVDTKLSF